VPLVVDAVPLSPSNNSYASVAAADDYIATRIFDETIQAVWTDLTVEQKGLYLVNASRALDSFCDWIGDRYSRDQGLKWPRVNAFVDGYLVDSITFPLRVVEAAIEMALWYAQNTGQVTTTTTSEFDSIKVGPINIDFNEGAGQPLNEYFPDQIAILLKDYGGVTQPDVPGVGKIKQVRLARA
jgi:hypothetical protein